MREKPTSRKARLPEVPMLDWKAKQTTMELNVPLEAGMGKEEATG